jgi:hypothetical protein
MDAKQKPLAISLIRAFEDILIENYALLKLAEEFARILPHVRKAFVATMRNDPLAVTLTHAKVQPLYDQIEHGADVAQVIESLLTVLRQRVQE